MVANAKESGNIDEAEYKVTTKEYIALALLLLLLLLLLLHVILYTSYYSFSFSIQFGGYIYICIYIYRQAIQYDATAMTAAAAVSRCSSSGVGSAMKSIIRLALLLLIGDEGVEGGGGFILYIYTSIYSTQRPYIFALP